MTLQQRLELLKKQVQHVRNMCCVLAKERRATYKGMEKSSPCNFCDFYDDLSCCQSSCVFNNLTSKITLETYHDHKRFEREIGELLEKVEK